MSYLRYLVRPTVAVALLLLVGCGNDDGVIGGSGLIETEEVLVSAEASGRVVERFFDEGRDVDEGDTLLSVDASRLELQLASARAQRKTAEANLRTATVQLAQAEQTESFAASEFDRIERLLKSGTATQRQFDQVKHEFTTAQIAVRQAKAQIAAVEAEIDRVDATSAQIERELRDTRPVAPVSGTVIDDYVEIGELLAAGRPIVKLARLDSVWVKVYLPAGDFARVKLGDQATVDTESDLGSFTGTVVWTSEEAEFTPKNVQTKSARADLVYAVKVAVANPDRTLKVGMPVFVTFGEAGE